MIEFGEKIKQFREEKGMTQQTMAERLYVTRQAVSRWECGARYPDLLTAKKIAEILDVSIDELISGEELCRNIEKEPVLAASVPNMLQTALYAIGVTAYALMCIFSIPSLFPDKLLSGTPAGEISLLTVAVILAHFLNLTALSAGLFLSVRNLLSPLWAGILMSVSYGEEIIVWLGTLTQTMIKQNGTLNWADGILPILAIIAICLFFMGKRRISPWFVYVLVLPKAYLILSGIRHMHIYGTPLGFVVRSTHLLGITAILILLVYQAYVLNKKRTAAVR